MSRSSRWTMPGRSGSSPPSASCASRPWTSVPVRWPAPGWTTTPAGLSTTRRCSSSQTTSSAISSGSRSLPRRGCTATSSCSPPASRKLLARAVPSTRTCPASTRRSASAREPTSGRPARKRSSRAPAASEGTGTFRTGFSVRGRERRRRGSRSEATIAPSRTATPTTMKMSARLKAGQKVKSRKSVTCPRRTRSTRFARLPPRTSPSPTGSTGWRAPERAKKTSIQAIASPVSAITIVVAVGKNPNAIPEFWTWWIENGPSAAVSSPSCS